MPFQKMLNKVREGIFHCIVGVCDDCPYCKDDDFEDCSNNLLWDIKILLTQMECDIFALRSINKELRLKQKED